MTESNKNESSATESLQQHRRGDRTPWLDAEGNERGEEELLCLSSDWTISQWESYVQHLAKKETPPVDEIPVRQKLLNELYDAHLQQEENERKILGYLTGQPDHPHLKQAVENALNALDEKEQKIVRLVFWENQTQRKIAEHLDISRTRVRQLLNRGLRKFKTMLLAELIASGARKDEGGNPHPCTKRCISEGQNIFNEEVPY